MSTSPPGPRPLVVTADDRVLDDVLRVAELCGVGLEVAHDLSAARRAWSTAPLIMIGSDLAASLARSVPSRRPGVVLLARDRLDGLDHRDWQRAVEIGVDEVVS
ncbi:MAG TPA: septum site-determining protein, partial [Actinopolymorphaceae bacterium]